MAGILVAGSLAAPLGAVLAAGPFDGTYVGTLRETENGNRGFCQIVNRDDFRRVVKNGVITAQWGKATLTATIGNDGTFSDTAEGAAFGRAGSVPDTIIFKGIVRDGRLEADIGSPRCAAHWSLRKT